MKSIKTTTTILCFIVLSIFSFSLLAKNNIAPQKPALMWFDAEANFKRFSNTDSIDFYLKKIKEIGFTHAIVDVLPITGEVLYDSNYSPRMREWRGDKRPDFDYIGYFIKKGHELGLEVHAS
ncbi:MAG: S-layer protein, partial [Muribaculaceae bacterium]